MRANELELVYSEWPAYNQSLVQVVRAMTDDQLAVTPAPGGWPIWATVAHTAGTRVYWLCAVVGEPGIERMPFPDVAQGIGWEDDLDHPREANELAAALDATFDVIQSCLQRWTVASLRQEVLREVPSGRQLHTRGSILQRLFSHDAYHCGELSQTLGLHGLPQVDLWPPAAAAPVDPQG